MTFVSELAAAPGPQSGRVEGGTALERKKTPMVLVWEPINDFNTRYRSVLCGSESIAWSISPTHGMW